MRIRKIVSLILALCLMVCLLSVNAFAADDSTNMDKRWNIMIVVDGSGSLTSGDSPSDPQGLRYEALNMFIDQLHDQGNNVGAIVFNANISQDDSEAGMRTGIAMFREPVVINGSADKNALKNAIATAPTSGHPFGDTDIGTALLLAQQTLSSIDNGLDSAIFLFSDGATEIDHANVRQRSAEYMDMAVQGMQDDNIKLCGVFLNCNGSDSTEVRDIVSRTVGGNSSYLGELYVEINDAADIPFAVDTFFKFLGYSDGGTGEPIDKTFERTFRIPGVGVEEANIRIRTADGASLPDGMVVSIIEPDGDHLSAADLAAICSSGRTYQIYKIRNPESGTWTVKVELPQDNEVRIYYNPILSLYVDAGVEVSPAPEKLRVNDTAHIEGFLVRDGSPVVDPADYREYVCQIETKNIFNGVIDTQTVSINSNNEFILDKLLNEYGVFDVKLSFVCDTIKVSAPLFQLDLTNRVPACRADVYLNFDYGLFKGNSTDLDLSEGRYAVTDEEDPFDALTFTVVGGSCDLGAANVKGGTLELNTKNCGDGDVVIQVMDTQGATATMTLHIQTQSVTMKMLIIAAAIVLLLLVIIVLTIRRRNGVVTNGTCNISIAVPVDNIGSTRTVTVSGLTPPGGRNCPRKTELNSILRKDIDSAGANSGKARQACADAKIDYSRFLEIVNSLTSELRAAKVSCVFYKDKKSKRLCSDRIKFKYRKTAQTISSGNSVTVRMGDYDVSFSYGSKIFGDEDFNDNSFSGGGFGAYGSGASGGMGFAPSADGMGFAPPANDMGFAPPAGGMGFTPPANDMGFAPPAGGMGFTPPANDKGFTPPANDKGFTPPANDMGFAPPAKDAGFAPPANDMGFAPPAGNAPAQDNFGFGGDGGFGFGSDDGSGFGGSSGSKDDPFGF